MFGDKIVRAEAALIADPKGLIQKIDAAMLLPNQTPAVTKVLKAVKDLILDSVSIEFVQTKVDSEYMQRFKDDSVMNYTMDELRFKMGERLVTVVSPVVTVTEDQGL